MTSSEKPHLIEQKLLDFQRRQSAREYVCPLCSRQASFHQELKLWEHAKQSHVDYLESGLEGDIGQRRKQFSEEAILKAYVNTNLEVACVAGPSSS